MPEDRRLRALAFWIEGCYLEPYEHALPGASCEGVIHNQALVHFPDEVIKPFPQEQDLKRFPALSYLSAAPLHPHQAGRLPRLPLQGFAEGER